MKRLLVASVTAVAALASLPAAAQFQKPEDAIKYRQSALTVMANHFSRVAAMAQGKVPFDAKVAADNGSALGSAQHHRPGELHVERLQGVPRSMNVGSH